MAGALTRKGKIDKWGNSAAVRLTGPTLEAANLHHQDHISIVARDGQIIIRKQKQPVTLDALLAGFDPAKHRHALVLDDPPVGHETI